MASQEDYLEGKTVVIYGAENIINSTLKDWSRARSKVDICGDSDAPSIFLIPNHPITKAFRELKDKEIKIRFIAEITNDNLSYCKELMKICELRHLDKVKGNFGVMDGIY